MSGLREDEEALRAFFERKLALLSTEAQPVPTHEELEDRCRKEVQELHEFMTKWFLGVLPRTDEEFQRFAAVMDESYSIITSTGETKNLETLTTQLDCAHGCMQALMGQGRPGLFWIQIKDVMLQQVIKGNPMHFLITYEEWHIVPSGASGRACSVLLRDEQGKGLPNDLVWLHSHETTLPDK
mmetsp:Transcript_9035/g.22627  ORF Transcript_9035/g.22627 Transcript_9035/m.22627 type:complete len:183 (+) Transcript_9035:3-551(+)